MNKVTALFAVAAVMFLLGAPSANAQEESPSGEFFGTTRQEIVEREEPMTPATDGRAADAPPSPASAASDFVRPPQDAARGTITRFAPAVTTTPPSAPDIIGGHIQQSGGGNQNAPAPAVMTPGEKMRYSLRQSFLTPGAYIGPVFRATVAQWQDEDVPAKTGADRAADYLSHYARAFGTGATTQLFSTGIYPIIFKQNPVYQPSGKKGTRARLLHAISRVVVTEGDGGETQPNYSRLAGSFTGAALANLWSRDTPRERNEFGVVTEVRRYKGVSPTFQRFGTSLGFNALSLVLNEFFGIGK